MKVYPLLVFLISILLLQSCNNIEHKDLIGDWISIPTENDYQMVEIAFYENVAYRSDPYLFIEKSNYSVKNNTIHYKNESGTIDTVLKIKRYNQDSIQIGNLDYRRVEYNYYLDQIHYSLIGIKTENIVKALDINSPVMHLTRTSDKGMQVRLGDKYADIKQIPEILSIGHKIQNEIIIFIGENITLLDLQEIQYNLFSLNIHKITYVLDKSQQGGYSIFKDFAFAFPKTIENHFKNKPPYPPMPYGMNSREEFVSNGGKPISIKRIDGLNKLSDINTEDDYLIEIDPTMSFQDFITIKSQISALRKERNYKFVAIIGN